MNVTIVNQSSKSNDELNLQNIITAINVHAQKLKKYWDVDFIVTLANSPDVSYNVYLLDHSDVGGALGYHDIADDGTPYAKVFVLDAINDNVPISVVLSHEIYEMIVNPYVNRFSCNVLRSFLVRFYFVEICDPVESVSINVNNIPLSDFVYPSFYGGNSPYDDAGVITKPYQPVQGGFVSYYLSYFGNLKVSINKTEKTTKCGTVVRRVS
jgi:hypothetical protein